MKIKKLFVCILFIMILAGGLTACAKREPAQKEAGQKKYTVYLGLNDAETGTQLLDCEEAKELARAIIVGQGIGYKEYIAFGAYLENGDVITNDTLVYEFYFVDESDVSEVVQKLKDGLNLASVYINEEDCNFYADTDMR